MTPASGDQGVDLVCDKRGVRLAIQCKAYTCAVGNSAVQEALAGKAWVIADHGVVVATGGYTRAARDLAGRCGVKLLAFEDLPHADRLFRVPAARPVSNLRRLYLLAFLVRWQRRLQILQRRLGIRRR